MATTTTATGRSNFGVPKPTQAQVRLTMRPVNVHAYENGSGEKPAGRSAVVRVRLSVVGAGSPSRTQFATHHHPPTAAATTPATAIVHHRPAPARRAPADR